MTEAATMSQVAPFPHPLRELVDQLVYRDDWTFYLDDIDRGQGSAGLTLAIRIVCQDSYDHSQRKAVMHYMLVPPAAFDRRSWQRWLFDQVLLVERHEAMEFFTIDGGKPYAPSHGPGNDPYLIREVGTDLDQRTAFTGDVNPE